MATMKEREREKKGNMWRRRSFTTQMSSSSTGDNPLSPLDETKQTEPGSGPEVSPPSWHGSMVSDATARGSFRRRSSSYDAPSPGVGGRTALSTSPSYAVRSPETPLQLSTWRNSVSSAVYEQTVEPERQRQNAIFEFIDTEQSFADDLQCLLEVYSYSVFATCGISVDEHTKLFSPLELLRDASSDFCADLRAATEPSGVVEGLGDVFLLHIPNLAEPLTTITLHKTQICSTMARWKKGSNELARRMDQGTVACGGLDFDSYILKPFQRLSRYPMLLKEVLKRTPPDNPDFDSLTEAQRVSTALLADCNEAMRDAELRAYVGAIAAHLVVPTRINPDSSSFSAVTMLQGAGIDVVRHQTFDQVKVSKGGSVSRHVGKQKRRESCIDGTSVSVSDLGRRTVIVLHDTVTGPFIVVVEDAERSADDAADRQCYILRTQRIPLDDTLRVELYTPLRTARKRSSISAAAMDKKPTYVRLEFVDHWSSNTDLPDDIVLEASSPNAAEEFVQAITELRHKDDVILKQTDLNEILRYGRELEASGLDMNVSQTTIRQDRERLVLCIRAVESLVLHSRQLSAGGRRRSSGHGYTPDYLRKQSHRGALRLQSQVSRGNRSGSLENVLVGASTDTKPDSVRRREAALRRRVVDLTTLVQQHESFAEESRAAYESEITQLQQQLDEEQKLCDEFLNYSKGRKANEASALEALSECAVVSDAAGTNKGPSVNTLQAQLDDLTDDRDKTAERCASLGHECEELQLQLVEAHGVCASTKAELARISTEREQLAETERPAEPVDDAARIALQEQCATLTRECAELRQELGEARETSVADKADLVRITDEGVAALKDRNAVAIERDTLQADLAELTNEVEDAAASQAEFTALQADVAAALAIVSQHDAALSGTGSIESAMQSMATKLITAEDELIEVTQQLGEILELSNEPKLAELQAELDECHETIEHLAMQLEVDEESRDSTTL